MKLHDFSRRRGGGPAVVDAAASPPDSPIYNGARMLDHPALFARALLKWYDRSRRDLPWRLPPGSTAALDPYHVLVSEAMLQQTQVATVIPYFNRFVARFPNLAALAAADEQEVLRLWQGLGYYSRARNLQAAARAVIDKHGGQLPADPQVLLTLPGVGRYTAGAVASIAFGRRAPIVDGNVVRVLCRVDLVTADPRDRLTQQLLWNRAEEILPAERPGDFNSAMMELGATVCTPRAPQCLLCPVRAHCEAFAAGMQLRVPAPKKTKPTPLHRRVTFCIEKNGKWLIEQRPGTGRWAGLWQFVTLPLTDESATVAPPLRTTPPTHVGEVTHALTHRRYHFTVLRSTARGIQSAKIERPHAWVALDKLGDYPLPRPHLEIAEMLLKPRQPA